MRNRPLTDSDRLEHVLDAISKIKVYCSGMKMEDFLADSRTQSAVLYQFVIIGEAIASLTLDLTEKYDYPWHKPRSFRNYIAHEYHGIQMRVVWDTIIVELPKLEQLIADISGLRK